MALPTVGSTAPCVFSCHGDRHRERFKEQGRDDNGSSGLRVEIRELRVRSEATTGEVDGIDLVSQDRLRPFGFCRVEYHDRGSGADGTKCAFPECRFDPGHHREVPPEVTTGRVVVVVGGLVVVVVVGGVVAGVVLGVVGGDVAGVVLGVAVAGVVAVLGGVELAGVELAGVVLACVVSVVPVLPPEGGADVGVDVAVGGTDVVGAVS